MVSTLNLSIYLAVVSSSRQVVRSGNCQEDGMRRNISKGKKSSGRVCRGKRRENNSNETQAEITVLIVTPGTSSSVTYSDSRICTSLGEKVGAVFKVLPSSLRRFR